MKRGFLNTSKGKKALSQTPTSPSSGEPTTKPDAPEPSKPSKPTPKTPSPSSKAQGGSVSLAEAKEKITELLSEAMNAVEKGQDDPEIVKPYVQKVATLLKQSGMVSSDKEAVEYTMKMLKNLSLGKTKESWNGANSSEVGGSTPPVPGGQSASGSIKQIFSEIPAVYREPSQLIVTTVPKQGGSNKDGNTVWLGSKATVEKILGPSSAIAAIPKPKSSKPAFIVKSTPDKGLGVFATRDIESGELIFSERPLLIAPASNAGILADLINRTNNNPSYGEALGQTKAAMEDWEGHLRRALDEMLPDNRDEFMKLANSHLYDGSGPILGIIRTNGFGITTKIYDGDALRPDQSNGYTAITKIGSRINHSCIPNVDLDFSTASFAIQFKACSDIKAGEELLYSYADPNASVARRRAQLAPYGFVCHCSACDNATPETDALRQSYKGLLQQYMTSVNWTGLKGRARESDIDPILNFHKALLKEGLGYTGEYKSTVFMLKVFYESLGMHTKARPYREELKKYPDLAGASLF